MDSTIARKLLQKYGVKPVRRRQWERLVSWINTFLVFERGREENIFEWENNSLKIISIVEEKVFQKYMLYSLVFLAQMESGFGFDIDKFCTKNKLLKDGILNIKDLVTTCNILFSYGKFQ